MKSGKSGETSNQRRSFLRSAFTLLGGTAALSVTLQSKSDAPDGEPSHASPEDSSKGYRETEHVRTYYEKVRF